MQFLYLCEHTFKLMEKNRHLRPMMLVGTGSDAGKSVINTAFCRIFKQDGYHPAPFKAQNMSLNSYSTPDGCEIGRAQAVQAEACGIAPTSDMNPVLLKPSGNLTSQVVLNGHPDGNISARDYFSRGGRIEQLFVEVQSAFSRLSKQYNPIVLEGAGSISEINLRDRDITNMRMALAASASVYLVADIDRGGLFASVYGTVMLLRPEERAALKGVIINKFRGDITLFDEGRKMLEELIHIPVVGIIPWFDDIHVEEEDSVELERKTNIRRDGSINVAVVLLDHLSNFTDFDVLELDPRFNLYYSNHPEELEAADIVIVPGSKNTIADLQNLRASGVADAIVNASHKGHTVIGICGGYQMMGHRILDPQGVEGGLQSALGLNLLPVDTVIGKTKVTQQSSFHFLPDSKDDTSCKGYEIHMGTTTAMDGTIQPLNRLTDDREDGCFVNDRCWGTYMHGILDNSSVLDFLAKNHGTAETAPFDYAKFKEEQYDKLAELVRSHCDMQKIYESLL